MNRSSGGEKIVYSLFLFIITLVVGGGGILFPLMFYLTVFISTHKFYLFSISHPHPAWGAGEG